MRRLFAAALVLGLAAEGSAHAQATVTFPEEATDYPTAEVGVYAGVPTGLSGKYWLSAHTGVDAALSWRFPREGYSFNLDLLAHSWVMRDVLQRPKSRLPLYAGAGVKVRHLADNPEWGARFPIGANALLDAIPISLFVEVAPGVLFKTKEPVFDADAGIGARVYF